MDSTNLQKYGFQKWNSLNKTSKDIVPTNSGVYVIRTRQVFGRLRGNSDIVYVGSSGNLNERIILNHINGVGGGTTQRIHKYLFDKGYIDLLEVSWLVTPDFQNTESKIRLEYQEEHDELPPWNRQE